MLLPAALLSPAAVLSPASAAEAGDLVRVAVFVDAAGGPHVGHVEVPADAVARLDASRQVTAAVDQTVRAFVDRSSEPLAYAQWSLVSLALPEGVDGAGQVVAVIDSGVAADHEDLAGQIVDGFDFVDGVPLPAGSSVDGNGHGTHIAGVVAASTGNGVGVASVAPSAKVMPLRALEDDGTGFESDAAEAVVWAVDNGATVVNLSLGADKPLEVLAEAIDYAVANGVPVVAAAGNEQEEGNPRIWPASLDAVIAVSAVDAQLAPSKFSSSGTWVDVAAPGTRVLSTYTGNRYVYMSGTSMAAPHVSATVALLQSRYPDLTPGQVRELLVATADDLGPAGFDERYGFGLVDPAGALAAAGDGGVEPPPDSGVPASLVVEHADRFVFGEQASVSATVLSSSGVPVPGQELQFRFGPAADVRSVSAVSDAAGVASAVFPVSARGTVTVTVDGFPQLGYSVAYAARGSVSASVSRPRPASGRNSRPAPRPVVTVSGTASVAPGAAVRVHVFSKRWTLAALARPDASGRFTVTVPASARYRVTGSWLGLDSHVVSVTPRR